MQCFQKDPNLRVSARKLLKHAWIFGSRRSDAVVQTQPRFDEAVKSVQQWNEALKSPNAGSIRKTPKPRVSSPIPPRLEQRPVLPQLETPSKGQMNLAKPNVIADAFRSPEGTVG